MSTFPITRRQPTLWRTCRVLANEVRLRMLQELIEHPDQTISQAARKAKVPLPVASQYLRALNARGLLEARRAGRWVHYRPCPDRSVPGAEQLLEAIQQTFATEKKPIELIFRQATAFTHPRRVEIVRALQAEGLGRGTLRLRTGISRDALARHLAKLVDRGFVLVDRNNYRCARPKGILAKALLDLACARGVRPRQRP